MRSQKNFVVRIVVTGLTASALSGMAVAQTSTTVYPTYSQPVVVSQPATVIQTAPPIGQVCPKCGRVHAPSATSSSPTSSVQPVSYQQPVSSPATISAGHGAGGVSNVLSTLNAQRSRQGLGSLRYDPALQAVAQRRAQLMASMGTKTHPPGSFAPGRYEGVGWNSSYSPSGVSACFTSDPNMRAAGAAMARGRDGVYFCVVYR